MNGELLRRIAILLPLLTVAPVPLVARELTFEARVETQRAIESVYWRHRTWPQANPTPKPPLSTVLSDAAIRAKVEDYLKLSMALETQWQRPLTALGLQAELNRMIRETRDPHMLRELFAALGDDSWLIAETLVRPALAQRLARRWYAYDGRFHGALEEEARAALRDISDVPAMRALSDRYVEQSYALRSDAARDREAEWTGAGTAELDAEAWQDFTADLARRFDCGFAAIPLGRPSELQEDADRFFVSALIARSEGQATIATLGWPKRPFDAWWEAERQRLAPSLHATQASYTLSEPAEAPCEEDTWDKRFFGPAGRCCNSVVWTGSEMIIWGGYYHLNSGARYDPATDTWLPTSSEGAPSGRFLHTTVWTGTEMIVWGGDTEDYYTATGGRYDPLTDQWLPTSTGNDTPAARGSHTAVWTGSEMIVWGGIDNDGSPLATGGRYDPRTDSWTPTSLAMGAPSPRLYPGAVWTGTEMIVWGGWGGWDVGELNSGSRYNPATDGWVPTSTGPGVPSPRYYHSLVWTGSKMIVWGGGGSGNSWTNTGGVYIPLTDTWTPTATTNAPVNRWNHAAVWTGTHMIVWGGYGSVPPLSGQDLNTGGRYAPSTNSWSSTSTGANVPSPRELHAAVWTGTEMMTWGGQGPGGAQLDSGGRYDPTSNTWLSIVPDAGVPLGRQGHTAVWTGAEMIVWGGYNGSYLNTGARYDPAIDAWVATPVVTAPSNRYHHTALWTGSEMIVWGGFNQFPTQYLSTGGRYNPAANSWSPTSTGSNMPAGREGHSAVWTGSEMIVWGGACCEPNVFYNTGGRYDPTANTWKATTTAVNTPHARARHTAVWTGAEMLVWGGFSKSPNTYWSTGGRYDPAGNTWATTSNGGDTPDGRILHTAVWTGSEMIIWGGYDGGYLGTGGRYDPATDSWEATATTGGAPIARTDHTAVWFDDRMFVWGGWNGAYQTNGAGYDPVGDEWSPISTTNAPEPRFGHTAVRADTKMMVWGGDPYVTDVDIYCAAPCAAAAPAHVTGLVAQPSGASVQWNWDAVAGAEAYDVVTGSVSELHATGGDFTASTTGCLADDLESTSVMDDSVPEAGGSWYLVRAVNCAGNGSFDTGTISQVGSRDAEIAASAASCGEE